MESSENGFQSGDWVIYRKQKISAAPGPRAQQTMPSSKGETYHYLVDKFWVVEQILADSRLQLITRTGKRHEISAKDPLVRKARWWERLIHGARFRAVAKTIEETSTLSANAVPTD